MNCKCNGIVREIQINGQKIYVCNSCGSTTSTTSSGYSNNN